MIDVLMKGLLGAVIGGLIVLVIEFVIVYIEYKDTKRKEEDR